ncbi:MAG: PGF-pre-PGF domain-containing protein [DPANN group archaeon]|nr:PGF-pre-PGF domain-containing protein [DPANN group archaeon]
MKWLKNIVLAVVILVFAQQAFAAVGSSSSFNVTAIEGASGGGAGSSSSYNVSVLVTPAAVGSSSSFNVSLGYVFSGEEKPQEQPAPQAPAPAAAAGGGGGAGAGSPTSQSTTLSSVSAGEKNKIDITKLATGLNLVEFALTAPAEEVKLTFDLAPADSIKSPITSSAIFSPEEAVVYKYVTVDTKNINEAAISPPVSLHFQVEKQWLADNKISQDKVEMYRLESSWRGLPTNMERQDSNFVYFVADSPGFSTFAIVGFVRPELVNAPAVIPKQAHVCGNSLCERPIESESSCPQDCAQKALPSFPSPIHFKLLIVIIAALVVVAGAWLAGNAKKAPEAAIRTFVGSAIKSGYKPKSALDEYVHAALRAGYKPDKIHKRLMQAGWHKKLTTDTIKRIKAQYKKRKIR